MGDQQDKQSPSFIGRAECLWAAVRENAKVAATVLGAIGTAMALVFDAGAQIEHMNAHIETNHVEIQLLREEVRLLESALLLPRKGTSP